MSEQRFFKVEMYFKSTNDSVSDEEIMRCLKEFLVLQVPPVVMDAREYKVKLSIAQIEKVIPYTGG